MTPGGLPLPGLRDRGVWRMDSRVHFLGRRNVDLVSLNLELG